MDLNFLKQSMRSKRMNLAEWRMSKRAELDLPSGLHVQVRKVKLIDLALSGKIPETLTKDMLKLAEGPVEVEPSELPRLMQVFDAVVRAMLVEPGIVETAAECDETHITVDELDYEDKVMMFQWANGGAEALRPFRADGGGDDLPAGADGKAVRAQAE
jgi:hypothetical protein